MAFALEDLLVDERLARLFQAGERACALQLWILQVKTADHCENRFVYGRLLPYHYASDAWSATDDDHFRVIGEHCAQIIQLNLYLKSADTSSLLNHLSNGETIAQASAALGFDLQPSLAARVGTATLGRPLLLRAVAYLLNRDSACFDELLSPHGAAGAFSASLSLADKRALFHLGGHFDAHLVKLIVGNLNAATGLDFARQDSVRIGDLEFLVFPTLDDSERNLLDLCISGPRYRVRLDPLQLPQYRKFTVRLSLANGRELVHSMAMIVEPAENLPLECEFEVPDLLRSIVDGTEIEIHGFSSGVSHGVLCCRWRGGYFREVTISTHVVGQSKPSVRLNWLERVTRSPKAAARLEAAQIPNQGRLGIASKVGDRLADPWSPVNRDVASLVERLHPPKSEGRFFERLSENDMGRLEFVEWIKNQLVKHNNHEVVLFDPYFEDAGVGLVVPNATKQGRYVVFTNLPKPSAQDTRINNLLSSCEQLRPLMRNVSFRVYGLKPETLHDRYLLFIDTGGVPVVGFHLSNSIQKANENYPLLITPIPQDVLQKVFKYSSDLLTEAFSPPDASGNSKVQLIFDSSAVKVTPAKRFEPLAFLSESIAGDILADWTGDGTLHGLAGEALREHMRAGGLLNNESLVLNDVPGFKGCVERRGGKFDDFSERWHVLAEILANTPTGDMLRTEVLPSNKAFLDFLARFLEDSFGRTQTAEFEMPIASVSESYFKNSVEELLRARYRPSQFFHPVKYAALSWAEYFAIKILWVQDPKTLITMMEQKSGTANPEDGRADEIRLSLMSQIASEASFGAEFGMGDTQRDRLVSSSMGLLKWLGLNVLKSQLTASDGVNAVVRYTSSFPHSDRVRVLGWMANDFATRPAGGDVFHRLVGAVLEIVPSHLASADFEGLVDSLLCGHRGLGQCEPWLFEQVIRPLLERERADVDDICRLWVSELLSYFEDTAGGHARIFQREAEGRVTATAAYLLSLSSARQQEAALKKLLHALEKARRTVQRPLASTLNWTQWDRSLVVALWIFAFARWSQYFLADIGEGSQPLERLSTEARRVALTRPVAEWQGHGGLNHGGLIRFVEELGAI